MKSVFPFRFATKILPPILISCSFIAARTVWAYVIPSSSTYASSTAATLTFPSGLTAGIAASGSNLVLNTTSNVFSGIGAPQPTYYSPPIAPSSSAVVYDANLAGCPAATTTQQICPNRGNITITFSQPVKNPRLHISGVGGRFSQGSVTIGYNAITTLTAAQNGSTPVTPAWSLIQSNSNFSATGTAVSTSTLTANTACNVTPNPAGCGTLAITGTVTQITLQIDLKYRITAGSGTLAVSTINIDTVSMTLSADEEFGDAPASFDPTQAAAHILGDLTLGSSVDGDNTTVANSTTSPNAVAAGANNNGTNGDGADEDAISSFPALAASNTSYALTVPISGASKAGQVCGWIDFNRNNSFDTTERACSGFASSATSVALNWTGLSGLTVGNSYVRLRASYDTSGVQSPTGRLNSGEVEDYQLQITGLPEVSLTKRITAVNGNRTINLNDSTPLSGVENDPTPSDNKPNWPSPTTGSPPVSTFLTGAVNGGLIKPGDTVEYTIYFLSSGDASARNVRICDLIPENQTFVLTGYNTVPQGAGGTLGVDRGIAISYNGSYNSFTNVADGDVAQFYPPGTSLPVFCNSGVNTTGAITVNLGQGATSSAGGSLPNATTPGTPTTSYGFIRFEVRTN